MLPYRDRAEGGQVLAAHLREYADRHDVIVLGLARGGVPVAYEVARALDAPLDVCVVCKLGAPSAPELALGAIASGGVCVLNEDALRRLHIADATINAITEREQRVVERRERLYRGGRPALDPRDQIVILVDDGLATGSTMLAAVRAGRRHGPARVVAGVPVGAASTCAEVAREADDIVCAATPPGFCAVSQWYQEFFQVSDTEVRLVLARAAHRAIRA